MSKQRYAIRYTHGPLLYGETPAWTDTWFCTAYDYEHALEKFHDSDEGFEPLAIACAPKDNLNHRWHWKKLT